MKHLTILVFLLVGMAPPSFETVTIVAAPLQAKAKYLSIQINKYEDEKIELLLSDLRGYEGKVVNANFYPVNHILTVYYTDLMTIDNIVEVVLKYCSDIEKVGGTDL